MERQPQPISQQQVVVALHQLLTIPGLELHVGVAHTPGILWVEVQAVLNAHTRAPVVIPAVDLEILGAVAAEQPDGAGQLLVDAETHAFLRGQRRVVGAEPQPVGTFGQREGREGVPDFAEREQRLRQIRRVVVALLQAELEPEPVLGIELSGDTRSVAPEAEHLVVDERVAEELRAFIVRERVRVEVIGQVEAPGRQGEPVAEQLGPQPDFTQVQLRSAARAAPYTRSTASSSESRRRAATR